MGGMVGWHQLVAVLSMLTGCCAWLRLHDEAFFLSLCLCGRLVHNHISPHNAAFYKLLDELNKARGRGLGCSLQRLLAGHSAAGCNGPATAWCNMLTILAARVCRSVTT